MQKIVTYSAFTDGADKPRDDNIFSGYNKFNTPIYNSKIYKIMPHKFLDCEISIYMDGNIFLNILPEQIVNEWLGDADIALLKHPHRESVYWEYKWIEYQAKRKLRIDDKVLEDCKKQIDHYREIGFPSKTGMFNCGFMIRRHNRITNQFNEAWWAEICRWSQRDQLSFPVIKLQYPEIKINGVVGDIRHHPYLKYEPHFIP